MDENAFRQKLAEAILRPCTFEKSLQTRCVACERSDRVQIAEREAVTCRNAASLARCTELHGKLRHSFAFALGYGAGRYGFVACAGNARAMRRVKGLQFVLDESAVVDNVDGLVESAVEKWGELAEIPYSEVVHAAALCYKGRHG